jgi:hypothetical protein
MDVNRAAGPRTQAKTGLAYVALALTQGFWKTSSWPLDGPRPGCVRVGRKPTHTTQAAKALLILRSTRWGLRQHFMAGRTNIGRASSRRIDHMDMVARLTHSETWCPCTFANSIAMCLETVAITPHESSWGSMMVTRKSLEPK